MNLSGPSAIVPATGTLARRLGPVDAAAIVISNVIGGGIFFVPVLVARLTPSAGSMLGVWLFGGLLAFAGAMAYAELATLRPRAGGEYVYSGTRLEGSRHSCRAGRRSSPVFQVRSRRAQWPWPTTSDDSCPQPATARRFYAPGPVRAAGAVAAGDRRHSGDRGSVTHSPARLGTARAQLAGRAEGFGACGVHRARVVRGRWIVGQPREHARLVLPASSWLLALVPVMFSYSGWNAAAYVAEEIRDPSRNLPRALAGGTLAVIAIYLLLNVLYLYAMPLADLAALPDGRLTDVVAERLFGFVAGNILAVFTIVSIAASVSAMVLAGPRVYFAMARDGVFLRAAGRVLPTQRTPALAIAAQAAWSAVLVLSGSLAELVAYTGFAVVLFSGVAVLALFVLRRREPGAERPFKALGYPAAPAVFVLASFLMVGNEVIQNPRPSFAGLAIILAGCPVYWFLSRRMNRP